MHSEDVFPKAVGGTGGEDTPPITISAYPIW